ncbi:MAG: AsmA family protein [Bacteroidetes bacterium]|nr:AsmA family protein [Bacteroidota bacterium]
MNKFLKIFLYLLSTIIILLGALVGYIYVNFEEIKQGALAKLNTYISVPIDVKKIDFTFVKSFPQVSLELDSVFIKSALSTSPDSTMLKCSKVSIGFDFWDIFNQKYKFKKIKVSDGEIHLYTDKNGKYNFDILKKDSSSSSSTSQNLQLKNVVFDRIRFTYIDQQQQIAAKTFVQHLVFAGDFKETIYDLSMQTAIRIDDISVNSLHYQLNQEFKLQSKLQINRTTKVYKVMQGEIENNQLKCNLSGLIKNEAHPFFDLKFSQDACDLLYLSRFLPESYQKKIKDYSTKGNISLTATLKGTFSESEKPVFTFKSVLNNGELVSPDKKFVAKKMSFDIEGASRSEKYPDGFVSFSNISSTINQSVLSADLFIENFTTPKIKTMLLSHGNLKDFESLITASSIKIYNGKYDCQVKLNGLLSDISDNKYEKINIEKLMFQAGDVKLDYNKNHLSEINFGTRLENGDLYIDETEFSYNNQPVKLNVEVRSFLPFLFTGKSPFVTL